MKKKKRQRAPGAGRKPLPAGEKMIPNTIRFRQKHLDAIKAKNPSLQSYLTQLAMNDLGIVQDDAPASADDNREQQAHGS